MRARMRGRAHFKEGAAQLLGARAQTGKFVRTFLQQIAFIGDNDLSALSQLRAVLAQLGIDRIEIRHRIASFAA